MKKLMTILLGLATASAAQAASVCIVDGNIVSARESCDGNTYSQVSLSQALQSLVTEGYKIAFVTPNSDASGGLTYTLIKDGK